MKKWGALITLALAMFIIVIDTTIMNVSISALIVDLNTTVTGVQSAISIYALVMASFMLIGGKLADIVGKKRIFIIGLIIYAVGTTTASISTSLPMLIIGWSILEGLGAALMIPNIQTLLRDEYEGADLAFAYGIVSAVAAVGAAVGPIVGGFFTTYISWRWAFRTELVVAIAVLVLTRYLAKDVMEGPRPRFDFVGAILSIIGWSSIVLGTLSIQRYGFFLAKEPFTIGNLTIAPFGLSIAILAIGTGILVVMLFLHWERHLETNNKDGLFRPSILMTKGLKPSIATRFFQMAITAAFLYLIPLMLQLGFEFNAMQTGLALMPFSIALLIAAIFGARLSSRFMANRIIQVGLILATVGLAALGASISPDATPADLALGVVFGIGIGLVASQILNLVLSMVSAESVPETAGLNSTFEQLGNAIGVALIGTIMLTTLSAVAQSDVNASTIIPDADKSSMVAALEDGVELMSDTSLANELAATDASAEETAEVLGIYHNARTNAFKVGVGLLVYLTLLSLVVTLWLPKKKLVSAEAG